MERSLTEEAKTRIREIHSMSCEYNAPGNTEHTSKLLDLMEKHIQEIKELYLQKNEHFLIETGDLLVLCFEVFEEYKKCPDEILEKCYNRYVRKLKKLLSEVEQ